MKYWRDQGASTDKLLLGIATYGRTFRTTGPAAGLGSPASGAASAGAYTRESGFWAYYEVLLQTSAALLHLPSCFCCTITSPFHFVWMLDLPVP